MSLDLYLYESPTMTCPHCSQNFPSPKDGTCLYEGNITHNLNTMADAAGLYEALWRPALVVAGPVITLQVYAFERERQWDKARALEESFTAKASDILPRLRGGIATLRSDPEKFRKLNPLNGWGDYDGLLMFATNYLTACEEHPDATIRTSR